jgi:hypothetical protein
MITMWRLIFAITALTATSAVAQTPMQFQAFPPAGGLWQAISGDSTWNIYASGTIDNDADLRLEQLIRRNNIPRGSSIYLHSPGGNMSGGMKLGKMIRKYQLMSDVGKIDLQDTRSAQPGECYSACAMAFLGGEYRFLKNGSVYGVHRFFWETRTEQDADLAQMMSAVEVDYIRSMDVNPELFTIASRAGRDEVVTPSREALAQLNVVNDGLKKVKWTIESVPQGIYLKGERETVRGINKFMIVCSAPGAIQLYIVFGGGNHPDDALNFNAETLVVDGRNISLAGHRVSKTVDPGHLINLFYAVDQAMLNALGRANTVGIMLQPTTEAAFFWGFIDLPFEEGRKKLPGYLQACKGGPSPR